MNWNLISVAGAVTIAGCASWFRHARPTQAKSIAARFRQSANRQILYIVLAALVPVLIRLAILPWLPAPEPSVHDEHGHLLAADTLANGRLANPPHPLWKHFETIYVLQRPAYASSYTLGQATILAAGQLLFGHPWAGVLLAVALMGGAATWTFYGCLPPGWAASGGLLLSIQFGLVQYWVNSYWGGAFCAFGGGLVFGALCRLDKQPSRTMASLLGLGWAIVWLIRPFESVLLLLVLWAIVARFALRPGSFRKWVAPIACLVVIQLSAGIFTALHNRAVTGSFTTIPYALSQKLYGVPQGFLWQQIVEEPPLRFEVLKEMYSWQRDYARQGLQERVTFSLSKTWEFFVGAWYSLPLLVSLFLWRDPRIAGGVGLVALALAVSGLYPFFFPHYIAAYAVVMVFLAIRGLMRITEWKVRGYAVGLFLAIFLVSGAVLSRTEFPVSAVHDYWAAPLQPSFRTRISQDLNRLGGQHVIFVRYTTGHDMQQEWVHNGANIDSSPIIWCRWMGAVEDAEVAKYYAGRKLWLAEVGSSALMSPYSPTRSSEVVASNNVVQKRLQ